jgi:hypothetical protein
MVVCFYLSLSLCVSFSHLTLYHFIGHILIVSGVDSALDKAYADVSLAAEGLCDAIAAGFPLCPVPGDPSSGAVSGYEPVFDPVNNLIVMKKYEVASRLLKLSGEIAHPPFPLFTFPLYFHYMV